MSKVDIGKYKYVKQTFPTLRKSDLMEIFRVTYPTICACEDKLKEEPGTYVEPSVHDEVVAYLEKKAVKDQKNEGMRSGGQGRKKKGITTTPDETVQEPVKETASERLIKKREQERQQTQQVEDAVVPPEDDKKERTLSSQDEMMADYLDTVEHIHSKDCGPECGKSKDGLPANLEVLTREEHFNPERMLTPEIAKRLFDAIDSKALAGSKQPAAAAKLAKGEEFRATIYNSRSELVDSVFHEALSLLEKGERYTFSLTIEKLT